MYVGHQASLSHRGQHKNFDAMQTWVSLIVNTGRGGSRVRVCRLCCFENYRGSWYEESGRKESSEEKDDLKLSGKQDTEVGLKSAHRRRGGGAVAMHPCKADALQEERGPYA